MQAINLDAERIGADMNAYTSKDTTVYYLNGLGRDAARMLQMLADVALESTFPEAEIERVVTDAAYGTQGTLLPEPPP